MIRATFLRKNGKSFVPLLLAGISAAQTVTWEQLIASGTEFHAKGRYAEAELAFRAALEKAETSGKPGRVATSLNDLGLVLKIRGDFRESERLYRRAISIREAMTDEPNLAVPLTNLSILYVAEGQYDRAEPLCRRALEIQMRISGPEGRGVAQTLDTLGNLQLG